MFVVVGNVNIEGSFILVVDGLDIVNTLDGKNATLTAATAVGAQPVSNGSTIKCLKTAGNLSMTSGATSITLTGSSNTPIPTTSEILA